jgi:hypothetical protein
MFLGLFFCNRLKRERYRMVDQHQLIHYSDLMAYKERVDRETSIAIDEMATIA